MSDRPDPDALLRRVEEEERRAKRGKLKVFFGAAPGVGKTYTMLQEAGQRRVERVDVVVGWLETHGRAETAALATDLPRLPAREIEYRGVKLAEFDLDGALARKPALLLLDELPHTNAPGSRHAKRWQDADELLEAGIDVYTTLNVQHLESLNDLVNQVTGTVVRETVPDRLLDEADEIKFVDLPPEDLLQRLAEGKVYLPDRAAEAVRNFFRRGNLHALRELALRRTAEHVDAHVRDYRRAHEIQATWPVAERILVCVRPNPESDRLVRAARRMAGRLQAEWIVAHVESPSQPQLSQRDREGLAATMKLAEELGAETAVLSGDSVSDALAFYARERNASKIVIGKPTHARWRDRVQGSLLDEIVRKSGDVDVYIISGEQEEHEPSARAARAEPHATTPGRYLWAIGVVAACTLLCQAMFGRFDNANLVMVYLLGVAVVATRHGRVPSALAAVMSVAAFDFFFVPPRLTFAVGDTQYAVTFGIMLLVSLMISTLAVRVRSQAEAAREREQRTQVLYAMSRDLAAARSVPEVAEATSRHVSDIFKGGATLLAPGEDGRLVAAHGDAGDARETAVAQWAFEHGRVAGLGTDTLPGAAAVYVPLQGSRAVLGVLAVRPHPDLLPLPRGQVDLLETLARQAASGLERARLADEAQQARVAVEAERLRSALLSSVSHDLRTPLSVIEGAASTLLSQRATLDSATRRDLAETIHEEAERLNRRVRNLLDMTRLEAGAVELNVGWESLEEMLGAALERVERDDASRRIRLELPESLQLVHCDAGLLEQVLVNLLENALKYSPAGSPIDVSARETAEETIVSVRDRGPGVPKGEEQRIFDKFHRVDRDRGATGVGLGLAICRAIVVAHGGRIWVESQPEGGAAFHVALRRSESPPLEPAS